MGFVMVDISRYNKASLAGHKRSEIGSDRWNFLLRVLIVRMENFLKEFVKCGSKSQNLLDLGCARFHSIKYAKLGYQVEGADLSKESLVVAEHRKSQPDIVLGSVHFLQKDILEHLKSLPEASVDVITMHGVLYYLDWRVAIQEIRRVLKPKGLLYFVETNGSNPILNIYRRIRHSLTGYRDEQTTRHLIHKKQFIEISKNFSSCRIHFDDLCVLLCGFLYLKTDRCIDFCFT